MKERWLLPDGFEEILPAEARRLEALRRATLDLLGRWGYELVMPPMIEYLDSLLVGAAHDLDLQTFKITDQLTGRMMGIRPDMTPQAARIDAHYLKREAPARLCYAGPVLRTRPDELGGSREPLQVGAELFGHAGPQSDAEVLLLMDATLELAGIRERHIDLGHVGVFRALARHAKLSFELEAELFEALQRKARDQVTHLVSRVADAKAGAALATLLDLNGGADVFDRAKQSLAQAPADVQQALDYLRQVADAVARQPRAPALFFDLAELSGYHYYTGVVFSAFVPGHGRAIAKGGRYDGIGAAFGRARAATGFGADLRALLRLSNAADNGSGGILAPTDADVAEVARLRDGGERVVVALPGDNAEPSDYGCDRRLINKNGRWVVETAKR
ncbi:MAG TPA: ATP phosphoribosyltransferase regulatory subunit [Burkholderiales bacterium]|nr:ATP phosphoribosyltransferase regulatory subunit [Burkholderiales bacterium]